MRHRLGLILLTLSFVVWFPGISQPMLTLHGSVDKPRLVELGKQMVATNPNVMPFISDMVSKLLDGLEVEGTIDAYDKTRSIVGTAQELFNSGNHLVGSLIILFSVFIPITKGLLLLAGSLIREIRIRGHAYRISGLISKWSMADVFVVAITVSYLAANATRDMGEIFVLQARLEPGFYYFLSYCLLAILSAQLMSEGPAPMPEPESSPELNSLPPRPGGA